MPARGDLPRGRAGLGCALARQGHLSEALPHLETALAANPFDRRAAQALAQALKDTGRTHRRAALEQERCLLHRAAPELVPLEGWFAGSAPDAKALVSLVILCWNQLEYTRPCLESVLRFTRAPFELILVDNGSTDGTPAYLEALRGRSEPARVVVVRNEQNRGFAAGCNQGIAVAQGEYLVFLNNDTIVTPGWLEGLVALSRMDWPRVGLTGPVSNAATPEQTIPTRYTIVKQMLDFAREQGRAHAGQAREMDQLSGFCLLARRGVLAVIGGFDERFGLGFFEDDDLCLRARRAGYRLLVAQDVFIHHYGSRTVQALGLNPEEQLRTNHARFVEKWGEQTPQGYRNARFTSLGQAQATEGERQFSVNTLDVSAVTVAPARVSLCLIVKNEEANLRACIEPVKHLFHEVVVNDTGSSDGTVALARSLGVRVIENPWQDSFCLARNQSVEAATGDWIFWLDADDGVDAANARKLQQLFHQLPSALCGYALTCRCLSSTGGETDVIHVRLFPRHPQVCWQHRVHEQILPSLRSLGGEVIFTDIAVTHVGYTDPALRGRKLDRDLRLLEMERAELGDHPFTLFNLGCVFLERQQYAEALPLFEGSLKGSHVRDSIVRKLFAQIARCRWELARRAEALSACKEGLCHYPQDEELLFLLAQYCQESGEPEAARQAYHRLIEGPREGSHFTSTATGLRGFRAMNNLALVYQRQGNLVMAEAWFVRALEDCPGFLSGWLALTELLASQHRRQDAESVLLRALQRLPGAVSQGKCALKPGRGNARMRVGRGMGWLGGRTSPNKWPPNGAKSCPGVTKGDEEMISPSGFPGRI